MFRPFVVVFCIALSSPAAAITYDDVVSLGNSLLDDGSGGQRSPVVSEHLADRLGATHTKFAVGGSTTGSLLAGGQHTDAAANFGAGDLAVLWIGGNDFLAASAAIALGNFSFMNASEANLEIALATLVAADLDVVMFNLPDFALVPTVIDNVPSSFWPQFTAATAEWRNRLNALGDVYEVAVVDVFSYSQDIQDHPENYTVGGNLPVGPPEYGPISSCAFCLFFDPIHPSSLAQGFVTNEAIAEMNAFFDPGGSMPLEPLSEDELLALTGTVSVPPADVASFVSLAVPNPFRTETRWTFDFEPGADLAIDVFDVAGRRVARLGGAPTTPGEVRWDGRDTSGSLVAPGVYFLRAMLGERVTTQRVVRRD